MFLATRNPSVCKVTTTTPSRNILNDGKFYTFDNGSCSLYTSTGYLNTTEYGTGIYFYFATDNGYGSGVAICFTGSDWSNLNSWCNLNDQRPEILPVCLSNAYLSYPTIITSNNGPIPVVNSILFKSGTINCITICSVNSGYFCRSLNCGIMIGKNYLSYSTNYGTLSGTGCILFGSHNSGIINGLACFTSFTSNQGHVNGTADFADTSFGNFGVIIGTGSFGGTVNGCIITGCASGLSHNCCIIIGAANLKGCNFCIISGMACFCSSATNCCIVSGNACFIAGSYNCGTVLGTGYFQGSANRNFGTVTCICIY